MAGRPIEELNAGLLAYREDLAADPLAAKRVEVAIVTFWPVQTIQDFTTAEQFSPPTLTTTGDTPIGAAINRGIDLVTARKQTYRANGVPFYRPWVFLITDGGPTDAWEPAAARVKQGEESKAFAFFSVAVEGARLDVLQQLSSRAPLNLKGLRFRDLFQWLSNSQKAVSRSQPGDAVPLENPATPAGWASI